MRVGRQGEEVCAAAPLAQRVEQTEQVGLGHPGHAHFVPEGKTSESSLAECSLKESDSHGKHKLFGKLA